MKILSIETSCDDTAISIMKAMGDASNASFEVLADNSNSQIKIHIPYGGVYPVLAKREHAKNLPILLQTSLKQAKLEKKKKPVDAIAVTYGPGLEMCLWEGILFAQNLAKKWNVPLIPVNHMEGHIFSVFGKNKGKFSIPKIKTPILSLLVSGGHTQLILTKKWMQYEIVGESLDDAIGEAFDKVARMLDLPYPGGPQISKLAELQRNMLSKRTDIFLLKNSSCSPRQAPKSFREYVSFSQQQKQEREAGDLQERSIAQAGESSIANFQQEIMRAESLQISSFSLPRPMLHSKNFDFSFSGLKTAVLYLTKKIGKLDEKTKSEIALEFENAAIECLVYKTKKALEKYSVKTLIVAGGVAANKHLRNEIKKITRKNIKLLFPTQELSGDNSLMIGIAGYLNYKKNKRKIEKASNIKANGNLRLSK